MSDLRAKSDEAWGEFLKAFDCLACLTAGMDESVLIDLDVLAPTEGHRALWRLLIRRGRQLGT